ncbi:MAG: PAS domain S-box protein [Pseudomonadota bacterium]|nr:PAS domain S-box protein [Pseudomonadota bacterium]
MALQPPATAALDAAIVEHMSGAVVYANREGVVERWNASAAAMFGFSADEAVGQRMDMMVPEHLRAAHWRGFEAAMQSGTLRLSGRATLTRGVHKSGRKLYAEMSFSLVRDAAGAVDGSVAVARDVTERVESAKAAAAKSG